MIWPFCSNSSAASGFAASSDPATRQHSLLFGGFVIVTTVRNSPAIWRQRRRPQSCAIAPPGQPGSAPVPAAGLIRVRGLRPGRRRSGCVHALLRSRRTPRVEGAAQLRSRGCCLICARGGGDPGSDPHLMTSASNADWAAATRPTSLAAQAILRSVGCCGLGRQAQAALKHAAR